MQIEISASYRRVAHVLTLGLALALTPTLGACGKSDTSGNSGGDGGTGGILPQTSGAACGYKNQGTALHIADNIDLCLPPVVCTAETCPPPLGKCQDGKCVFENGYQGLQTLAEGWATHYCGLAAGGCHGVTQVEFPEVTAQEIATQSGNPVCDGSSSATGKCVGIAASSPMVVGNSQLAVDSATGKFVTPWGLGLTEASGLCYEVAGPGGTALVALTDRCGGYCKCDAQPQFNECGPCVSAPTMEPNCPCVGTVPGLYGQCCGLGCPTLDGHCDWCSSNNHPHFDLDDAAFNWVCGSDAARGSCKLTSVKPVPCLTPKTWPPGGGGSSWRTQGFVSGSRRTSGRMSMCRRTTGLY